MNRELLDHDDYKRQQEFLSHHTQFIHLLEDSMKNAKKVNDFDKIQLTESRPNDFLTDTISIEESIKIGDGLLYDFDLHVIENNTLICFIIENKYLLYDLDNSTKKVTLLKECLLNSDDEKQECQESLYRVRFFDVNYEKETEFSIIMAGKNGVIYLVNIERNFSIEFLLGHYTDIYDIVIPRTNALFQNLFFSCSKDRSIFLWNAAKKIKIAHFRDELQLHTDAVALAIHDCNLVLASSYYNGEILIWDINQVIIDKITETKFNPVTTKTFKTIEIRKAAIDTKDIHSVTCDSIKFIGDLIASRDTVGNVKISLVTKIGVVILKKFTYDQFESIWFLQLGFNPISTLLFLGNDNGEIIFWKKIEENFNLIAKYKIENKFLIRKVMIKQETSMLFAISDDGHAWIHDVKIKELLKSED